MATERVLSTGELNRALLARSVPHRSAKLAIGPASHTILLPALRRMSIRHFRDQEGKELVDLPRASLPDAATPAPVRFLPTCDATLLVHARRTQILSERYRPLVFNTRTPHSVPTFLIDGAVAGTWHIEGGRVEIKPFESIPRAARRDVDDEARRLTAFFGSSKSRATMPQ